MHNPTRLQPTLLQKAAWLYAGLFAFVVVLGHLPGVNDADGKLFGLFHITLYQDLLHAASGAWAAVAAWHSHNRSKVYFQVFGAFYFLDGVLGALTGVTFLDLGVFNGKEALASNIRIPANLPHILIGGLAMLLGFVLARHWARTHGPGRQ